MGVQPQNPLAFSNPPASEAAPPPQPPPRPPCGKSTKRHRKERGFPFVISEAVDEDDSEYDDSSDGESDDDDRAFINDDEDDASDAGPSFYRAIDLKVIIYIYAYRKGYYIRYHRLPSARLEITALDLPFLFNYSHRCVFFRSKNKNNVNRNASKETFDHLPTRLPPRSTPLNPAP